MAFSLIAEPARNVFLIELDLPPDVVHGLCNFPGLVAASPKLDRIM
jgi:hypothetical protein